MIALALILPPIIFGGFCLIKKLDLRKLLISEAICGFLVLVFYGIVFSREEILVRDTEYWTGYITSAEYYERWNERVSCRHPKYKTVTKTRPKYKTDSKGRTVSDGVETYTEQVQDGYEHLYDVDEHDPYWQMSDNNGMVFRIRQDKYNELVNKFGNNNFVNLHRHYHTINGNKYETHFNNQDSCMDVCSHTHFYENRIQASNSILKFRKVDKDERIEWGLFDYPEVSNLKTPMILGFEDEQASRELELLNAKFGRNKQIRVWILVFREKPLEVAYAQEAYWGGGNKNEAVLIIGLNGENKVEWGHCASWTDRQDFKVSARDLIYKQYDKPLMLSLLISDLKPLIENDWERKHFHDFKYLTIETPFYFLLICYILVIVASIIVNLINVETRYGRI